MKILLRILLLVLIVLFVTALSFTVLLDYTVLTGKVQQTTDDLGIRLDIPNIITQSRLIILQAGLCICLGGLIFLTFLRFNIFYSYLGKAFGYIVSVFKNVWKDVKTKEAVAILSIPFVASVYFGLTVPVSYDEAWTFLGFTSKQFYYCMVYYPYPNNHVFHSLIVNITQEIPLFDILFRMRIPVIITALLTWSIAYSFIKKYYSVKVAIFVVALSAVLFRSVYYSFLSRGYGMVALFFVIALYAAFNIIHHENRKKDWMFFCISGILGCYAVPSFLYPFATINLFIFVYNYKHIVSQVVANVVTGCMVLLLYTPIFLTSGFKALSANQFVSTENRTRLDVLVELPSFFYDMLENFFKVPPIIILIIIVIALLFALKYRNKQTLILWTVLVITPFILLFTHSVIPFHRTFIYYCFGIMFLIGISMSDVIERIPKTALIIVLAIIQILSVIHFKMNIAEDETFNTYANDVTDKILEKDKTYLVNYPHIVFDMQTHGYDMSKVTLQEATVSWANTDTIKGYDYIAIYKVNDQTKYRKLFYSNKMLNVYKE